MSATQGVLFLDSSQSLFQDLVGIHILFLMTVLNLERLMSATMDSCEKTPTCTGNASVFPRYVRINDQLTDTFTMRARVRSMVLVVFAFESFLI